MYFPSLHMIKESTALECICQSQQIFALECHVKSFPTRRRSCTTPDCLNFLLRNNERASYDQNALHSSVHRNSTQQYPTDTRSNSSQVLQNRLQEQAHRLMMLLLDMITRHCSYSMQWSLFVVSPCYRPRILLFKFQQIYFCSPHPLCRSLGLSIKVYNNQIC